MEAAAEGKFPQAVAILNEAGFTGYIVHSWAAVAEFFGCAEKTCRRWGEEPDWPCKHAGRGGRTDYDLRAIVRWNFNRWCEAVDPAKDSPALERMRTANAQLAELDLAERKRELVRKADAESALDAGITAFVSALTALRERLARTYTADAGQITHEFDTAAERVRDALRLYTAKEPAA